MRQVSFSAQSPDNSLRPLSSIFCSLGFCWDGCSTTWAPASALWTSQRWLMGLKVPDSEAAPAMSSQAPREFWEDVWRGAFSDRDSIIA